MSKKHKGSLIIIGGHEDKDDQEERAILKAVCQRAVKNQGKLVIVTAATQHPAEVGAEYTKVFQSLGVRQIDLLDIRAREDAYRESSIEKIRDASVIFFTGGDQLRITSQMGDSPVYSCLQDLYHHGTVIAGTSAGAAAMSETMLISGASDRSHKITAIGMAPGLGILNGVVIDSHFAERGRFGRLLGAVAQNPKNLGVGIDENTAIVVNGGESFTVIGSGAVYVVDGTSITFSSLSEEQAEGILSIYDVRLHVLGEDDCFDLIHRRPTLDGNPVATTDGTHQA